MADILVTVQELLDCDLWDPACRELGWDIYILNEGLIQGKDKVGLSWEQATRIGLPQCLAARQQRAGEE